MGKHFDIEAVQQTLLASSTQRWTAEKLRDLRSTLAHLDNNDPGTYLYKEKVGFQPVTTRYSLGYRLPGNAWLSVNMQLEEAQYNTLSTLCDTHQLLRPKLA